MSKVNGFEDLEIWILAREICNEVWYYFESTPLGKDFGLRNQMNTSSGSVMDNIAEGYERNGNREFHQFLSVAKASCGELRFKLYWCLAENIFQKNNLIRLIQRQSLKARK